MITFALSRKVTGPDPSRAPTLLVVEDDSLVRLSLSSYLRTCGFNVLCAVDAVEAVAIIKSDASIDLVFSDIRMPGSLDGFGLAQWVRDNRPCLPIILASGKYTKGAQRLPAGVPIMAKPYDLKRMVARIRAMIADGPS